VPASSRSVTFKFNWSPLGRPSSSKVKNVSKSRNTDFLTRFLNSVEYLTPRNCYTLIFLIDAFICGVCVSTLGIWSLCRWNDIACELSKKTRNKEQRFEIIEYKIHLQ
jgi:hypothetical protein